MFIGKSAKKISLTHGTLIEYDKFIEKEKRETTLHNIKYNLGLFSFLKIFK